MAWVREKRHPRGSEGQWWRQRAVQWGRQGCGGGSREKDGNCGYRG